MADEFPADLTTPVGRVRKYIPDLVQLPDPAHPSGDKSFIFSDEEIESFIADETADGALEATSYRVQRAAAWAMIALANSENLILKKIVTEDQQTDGPAVARQLIAAAQVLFDRADGAENTINGAEGFISVPYPQPDAYSYGLSPNYYRAPWWKEV